MMETWGYIYLHIGEGLAYAETELEKYRTKTGGTIAGHGSSTIDPDDPALKLLTDKCAEILRMADDAGQDLGAIPGNIQILEAKITRARQQKPHGLEIYTNDLLDEVRRIKNDFRLILHDRMFYSVRPISPSTTTNQNYLARKSQNDFLCPKAILSTRVIVLRWVNIRPACSI
jgi:hypothetical protein